MTEPPASEATAMERVTRTMALALGPAAVLLAIVTLPSFLSQLGHAHPLWTWAVVVGLFLPCIAASVASQIAPLPVLRGLAGLSGAVELLGLALLVPALPDGHLDATFGASWLLLATAAGTTAGAVAWPPTIAIAQLMLTVVLIGIDRALAPVPPDVLGAGQHALYTLLFNGIFVALAIATARAGRQLDEATNAAIAQTRATASAEARGRERVRVEALLHDSVLVALLASARGAQRAAGEATSALAVLDALSSPTLDDGAVPSPEWIWRLQAVTTELAPSARFDQESNGSVEVPTVAARALLEASAEALRNSIRHAGSDAHRAVHVRASGDGLVVTILDDGAGFDPADVPPGRLGISVSIRERMRSVPGGNARIGSEPGIGTRVELGWNA